MQCVNKRHHTHTFQINIKMSYWKNKLDFRLIMRCVCVLSDDITLTVDGKDTYEEVKRADRYR